MKKPLFLLFSIIAGLFAPSCTDEPTLTPEPAEVVETEATSRSIVTDNLSSTTNPNLLSDWENQETIKLNNVLPNGQNEEVTAPWGRGAVSTQLSSEFCKDIKKENGWMMLFHTFNRPGVDNAQSYMCLYNLFTGILKFFVYVDNTLIVDNGQWDLYHDIGNIILLEEPTFITEIDGVNSTNNELYFSNESGIGTQQFSKGWNGFDFRVRRYAQESIGLLTLTSYTKAITTYSFLGNASANTTGTITTTQQNTTKYNTAVGSYMGSKADAIVGYINNSRNGTVEPQSVVGSIATAALKAGLKWLLGSSTTTTYNSNVRLETEAEIKTEGRSGTNLSPVTAPISFNMDEVLSGSNRPSYLGVWTLKSLPTVYYDMITKIDVTSLTNYGVKEPLEVYGKAPYPTPRSTSIPEVIFNPFIKPYIKSYRVSSHLIDYKENGKTSTYPPFESKNLKYTDLSHSIYDMNWSPRGISAMTSIGGHEVNQNTQYYYQWTNLIQDRVVAMITLTMDIEYEGNTFTVEDTRAYRTKSATSSSSNPSSYHFPPNSLVVNLNGFGWATAVPKDDM